MINAMTFALLSVYLYNKEALDVKMQHLLWMFETWIATIVEGMKEADAKRKPLDIFK